MKNIKPILAGLMALLVLAGCTKPASEIDPATQMFTSAVNPDTPQEPQRITYSFPQPGMDDALTPGDGYRLGWDLFEMHSMQSSGSEETLYVDSNGGEALRHPAEAYLLRDLATQEPRYFELQRAPGSEEYALASLDGTLLTGYAKQRYSACVGDWVVHSDFYIKGFDAMPGGKLVNPLTDEAHPVSGGIVEVDAMGEGQIRLQRADGSTLAILDQTGTLLHNGAEGEVYTRENGFYIRHNADESWQLLDDDFNPALPDSFDLVYTMEGFFSTKSGPVHTVFAAQGLTPVFTFTDEDASHISYFDGDLAIVRMADKTQLLVRASGETVASYESVNPIEGHFGERWFYAWNGAEAELLNEDGEQLYSSTASALGSYTTVRTVVGGFYIGYRQNGQHTLFNHQLGVQGAHYKTARHMGVDAASGHPLFLVSTTGAKYEYQVIRMDGTVLYDKVSGAVLHAASGRILCNFEDGRALGDLEGNVLYKVSTPAAEPDS